MSIAVLIHARIHPERVAAVLSALRDRIEPQTGPSSAHLAGRLRERIFQRLGSDSELLSLGQWQSKQALATAPPTLSGDAVGSAALEPLRVHRLARLLTFERPMQRADVTACALIVPQAGDSPIIRERVVQDRQELRDAPGLVSHEIYVTTGPAVTYVSVHSWRQLSDLQRFREEAGIFNEQRLAEVGATLDRFTGALVAEYPLTSTRG